MNARTITIHPALAIINSPDGDEERLYVTNATENTYYDSSLLSQDIFLKVLELALSKIEETELFEQLSEFIGDEVEAKYIIEEMIELDFLIDVDKMPKFYDGSTRWKDKGWSQPFLYHFHTNNIEKDDYIKDPKGEEDYKEMKEKVQQSPIPSFYKKYKNRHQIQLENPNDHIMHIDNIFDDLVGKDKKRSVLTFSDLSRIVYYTIGQTSVKKDRVTGMHISKTSPSGGARHPNENYLFIHDVEGVKSGLYHYDVETHSLTLLNEGDYKGFVQQNIVAHKDRPNFKYKLCIVHTLIFERSMHRYRESRSFRAVNHDLGHIMQTLALVSSALKYNSYRGYSLVDKEVDKLIGIDGVSESSMTYTLIG